MNNNQEKDLGAIHNMADGMRIAFYLSFAVTIYEVYNFLTRVMDTRHSINIILGIAGTLLLWQLSRKLGETKKQAVFYWLAAGSLGYTRLILDDGFRILNFPSIALMLVFVLFAVQMVIWVQRGLLL
jgi:hypothetical protein